MGGSVDFAGGGGALGLPDSLASYCNQILSSSSAKNLRRDWRQRYARAITVSDTLIVVIVIAISQGAWLGWDNHDVVTLHPTKRVGVVPYSAVMVVFAILWLLSLSISNSRDTKIFGSGSAEYNRVLRASLAVMGTVAIIAFLLRIDLARGLVLIAFPVGTVLLLFSRWLGRKWIIRQWKQKRCLTQVFVVGSEESILTILDRLFAEKPSPYWVTAVASAIPELSPRNPTITVRNREVPVIPLEDDVAGQLRSMGADTLILAGGHIRSAQRVRQISWSLDPVEQHLIVAPGITDVDGPRITVRPVSGTALMHVDPPVMKRRSKALKRMGDIFAASVGLVLLSPVFLVIALLIKLSDGGPVFFRQRRVGFRGEIFEMWKFRSMRPDAEQLLAQLRKQTKADAGNSVLFKMKDDPRVTRVGKFLRRYSLDELPQLFNVLAGTMSLVGPRPPLERELEQYGENVFRRFLVKPGITGLWQVSGRSNLSWEDTVRLDLYYVENWSVMGDLMILMKTARAVVGSDGAY